MRALLDSKLPLRNKLILLIGTDEESANEDVKNYLETNAPPSRTIVVDGTFPVICAEKGWCGLWLKLPRSQSFPLSTNGFWLTDLQGGFSPSIVPRKATATLEPISGSVEDALAELKKRLSQFAGFRHGASMSLEEINGSIHITAQGRTVHSSVPETGHNALMDLLVFLDRFVKPVENEIVLMAKFGATYIGLDLHGNELGIAHHDEFMGDVTVAGDIFETSRDSDQLRGRAGRQGDPGSSQFFLSLEDDLMRIFAKDWVAPERAAELIGDIRAFIETRVAAGVVRDRFDLNFQFWLSALHAMSGDTQQAVAALRHAAPQGGLTCTHCVRMWPHWDNLRGDPEFDRVLAEVETSKAVLRQRLADEGMLLTPEEVLQLEEFSFDPFVN